MGFPSRAHWDSHSHNFLEIFFGRLQRQVSWYIHEDQIHLRDIFLKTVLGQNESSLGEKRLFFSDFP